MSRPKLDPRLALGLAGAALVLAIVLMPRTLPGPLLEPPAEDAFEALSLPDDYGRVGLDTRAGIQRLAGGRANGLRTFQAGAGNPFSAPDAVLAAKAPEPSPRGPRCQAVLLRPGDALALVDGLPVREGDSIEGWLVARIDAGGVLLSRAGQERRLAVGLDPGDDSPTATVLAPRWQDR
jgi:hypothetical protein